MRSTGAAAVLVTAAVAVAACGGSNGSSAKQDFIRQADAICRAGDVQVKKLDAAIAAAQRNSDREQVFAALARLTRRSVAVSTPFLDRLDALTPPAGDRDELKAWIASARRQVTLVGQLADAFAAQDETRVAKLSEQVDALATKNNAFAQRYGMTECARSN